MIKNETQTADYRISVEILSYVNTTQTPIEINEELRKLLEKIPGVENLHIHITKEI